MRALNSKSSALASAIGSRAWRLPDCPFGMWVFDRASGQLVAANAAACRIYGYGREELCRCSVDDICRSPLGSLLAVDLMVSPQEETVWHRRSDRSTFQTEISMIANLSADRSTAMVLVHPLILSSGGDVIYTSVLPPLSPDTEAHRGPFPSLRSAREGARGEPAVRDCRRAHG